MATFRKYGGTNFSPISNIVRHNILNSKSSSFNTSGLYNTKETYLSHLDMSGNSLLHVGNIYFQDGTFISSATDSNNGLSEVLGYGSSAGKQSMTDVGGIGYDGGTNQTSAYTGWTGSNTYKSATLTFDINGKITDVIDNSFSPYGLEDVLTTSGDGGGKNMTNLGDITQADDHYINQSGTGTGSNHLKDTSFNGNITQEDSKTIVQFGNIGSNTFRDTSFSGNITQENDKTIVQFGNGGANIFKDTSFNGNITQENNKTIVQFGNDGSNTFRDTLFNGNIVQEDNYNIYQLGNGKNLLKDTSFNGNITQLSGKNYLNDTSFNGICEYVNSYDSYGVTSPNSIPDRAYVDTIASGIKPTGLCKCATTGNINLIVIDTPLVIDTYTVLDQDRILVKSQGASLNNNESTLDISNGIYVYNNPPGSLTRAKDCSLGDDVTNQLTFISDGCLNRMKAFVQDVSGAVVGDNSLNYVPFYSLNYNLGEGLELVGGATLRVKSDLDFLTNVTINRSDQSTGYLVFDTPISSDTSGGVTVIYQPNETLFFDNNSDTSTTPNNESSFTNKSFKFFCNNVGGDNKQTNPLQFNSSSFSVDLSNNAGGPKVRYEAYNNIFYSDLGYGLIGHNFTGNCYIDGSVNILNNLTVSGTLNNMTFKRGFNDDPSSLVIGSTNSQFKSQFNMLIGYDAGKELTTGYNNMLIGISPGTGIKTGNDNLMIGRDIYYDSSSSSSLSSDNVVVGQYAGYKTSGNGNTFLGNYSGYDYDGSRNTFVGFNAGNYTTYTGGFGNTLLGADTAVTANNITRSTVIGYGASVSASNTIVLGTANETTQIPGNLTVTGLNTNFYNNIYFKNDIYFSGDTQSQTLFKNGSKLTFENGTTTTFDSGSITNFNGSIIANGATITSKEFSYLAGTTSSIQNQLNNRVMASGSYNFSGYNTFSSDNSFTGNNSFTGRINFTSNKPSITYNINHTLGFVTSSVDEYYESPDEYKDHEVTLKTIYFNYYLDTKGSYILFFSFIVFRTNNADSGADSLQTINPELYINGVFIANYRNVSFRITSVFPTNGIYSPSSCYITNCVSVTAKIKWTSTNGKWKVGMSGIQAVRIS